MPNVVLIVEDHEGIRTGLIRLMSQFGHDVIATASVKEGTANLSANPTHVVLNLNLPDGFGTTILKHIRDKSLRAKVAVVTGTEDEGLLQEAMRLSPDLLVAKTDWDKLERWLAAR